MIKKEFQTAKWMLPAILILLLFSCNKKDNDILIDNNVLVGTWVDTIKALPKGYYVDELIFCKDNSFTEKSSSYGTYSGQSDNELSGWFVRTGTYDTDMNKIGFLAEKVISWDSFWGGAPEPLIKHM